MFGSSTPYPTDYPYNLVQNFNEHYEIMYDKELNLHSNYSAQVLHTLLDVDLSGDMKTDYSLGNAGTIVDIDTNALYLLVRTDNGSAGFLWTSQLFFFKDN